MQAELDHHVRDTYNYVTVQADVVMPDRQLAVLEDTYRQAGHLGQLTWLCSEKCHIHIRVAVCRCAA